MDFSEYQTEAKKTAIYPESSKIIYPTMGLCSESGEVAGKIKKQIRDGKQADPLEIAKELGDTLWYISQIATDMNLSLEDIAKMNLQKLADRQKRGVLGGSGDNR